MERGPGLAVVVLALLLSNTAWAQDQPQAALPGWIAGSWISNASDRWTEEHWTQPRAGLIMGAGRNGRGETLRGWETMRIVHGADGSPVFIANPSGQAEASFPVLEAGASHIVFANPGHDFPQKIRYWREGDKLLAEVSLIDGGKAIRWSYDRIK